MIRDKINYPEIKTIKPFFWKECRFCGKEFERETGYRIWDYTSVNPVLYFSYCCNKCARCMSDVKMLVTISKIPSPPPLPPKLRKLP